MFFASAFTYAGASSCVYDAKSFEPEQLMRTLARERATFTSLVPTHYIMTLALPDAVRASCNVDSARGLLISLAPARKDTKLAILECFRNSQLLEMYGSTEQGWATLQRPDEQLTKLGSIGRELTGCGRMKVLDDSKGSNPKRRPDRTQVWQAYFFCGAPAGPALVGAVAVASWRGNIVKARPTIKMKATTTNTMKFVSIESRSVSVIGSSLLISPRKRHRRPSPSAASSRDWMLPLRTRFQQAVAASPVMPPSPTRC